MLISALRLVRRPELVLVLLPTRLPVPRLEQELLLGLPLQELQLVAVLESAYSLEL